MGNLFLKDNLQNHNQLKFFLNLDDFENKYQIVMQCVLAGVIGLRQSLT
jgi:hypothetical protein